MTSDSPLDAPEEPAQAETADPAGEPDPNEVIYRVMTVGSVRFDLGTTSPQIHLVEEESPYRNVSISVALSEAQSLHNALIGSVGVRPSTHELTSAIIAQLRADIIAVRILRHEHGVFYSELDLMTQHGRERFDCRTSDGVILAIRQAVAAPILCAEEVLASFYD
ncbi:MAG: bifunctional nuclease domain-containing protein [Acidimicrobiales bacterium]